MEKIQSVVLGNEAIGRGLIEAGCHFVTSYPGTPSSEILPSVVKHKQKENLNIYANWSVNEKIAFETALASSWSGKRSAVIMKQVGLNVAADAMMSASYTGTIGGFIIISADDPGPHSSQTEQDTRFFGIFAKLPVFDPSTPAEAMKMIETAFEYSEKYEIPVIFRPSLRVCHARQNVTFSKPKVIERPANFVKNSDRWAATPRFRYQLHIQLNEKLNKVSADYENDSTLNYLYREGKNKKLGIIACGISFSILDDTLDELGVSDLFSILKISTPYPLPVKLVDDFISKHDSVLILEDTDAVVEFLITDKTKLLGRLNGFVPDAGELDPETIINIIYKVAEHLQITEIKKEKLPEIDNLVGSLKLPVRKPTLCPGCGHRAAFFAIKKAFPKGIYTSDIGCYTLGINLKAVDVVLDMGASVNMATGFHKTYAQDDIEQPVIATIGDSTFYHSGVPGLIDAVYNNSRYILCILDNDITAMTGMQPTPGIGYQADKSPGLNVPIPELVKGCGVRFVETVDPYDMEHTIKVLKDAYEFNRKDDGGMAVVIAKHPCMIAYREQIKSHKGTVYIDPDVCIGCRICEKKFECPALVYSKDKKQVSIDRRICVNCGVCITVCPQSAIKVKEEE